MAGPTLRNLLAKAKQAPGKVILLELKVPHLNLWQLKLFAEKAELGPGIILYAVSPDFQGKSLAGRSDAISEILDEELTDRELQQISHLFTFTPSEFKPNTRRVLAAR